MFPSGASKFLGGRVERASNLLSPMSTSTCAPNLPDVRPPRITSRPAPAWQLPPALRPTVPPRTTLRPAPAWHPPPAPRPPPTGRPPPAPRPPPTVVRKRKNQAAAPTGPRPHQRSPGQLPRDTTARPKMPAFSKAKPRLLRKVKGRPIAPNIVDRNPEFLGEWATSNAEFLKAHGWRKLAEERRGRSSIDPDVGKLPHAAAGYLDYLRTVGAPVHSTATPKTPSEVQAAAERGPHPSAIAHREFLWEEAYEMCQRRHTMVLPLSAVKDLDGVQVSPPMVAEQRDRRPRTLCDLTYSKVNENTALLAPQNSMQFGQALRRLLIQIHCADP